MFVLTFCSVFCEKISLGLLLKSSHAIQWITLVHSFYNKMGRMQMFAPVALFGPTHLTYPPSFPLNISYEAISPTAQHRSISMSTAAVDSIAVPVFVLFRLSLTNTESEKNPRNNLMMRREGLSIRAAAKGANVTLLPPKMLNYGKPRLGPRYT